MRSAAQRQEAQLRREAARICPSRASGVDLPSRRRDADAWILSKWLYRSHAIFGQYLFLCSGAVIRYEQVVALGGFNPQIRITEDYEFFTRAIRAGGAHFLERISVNYRLGSIESLWSPLEPSTQEEMHHAAEVRHYLTRR
jgi:hypothetical protein